MSESHSNLRPASSNSRETRLRVAVVGPCASGKSSVVAGLRERGLDAYAVAQEHSAVAELWRHLSPDRVVFLQTSLASVRRRRQDSRWPAWIYRLQAERLENARAHADVVVTTDELDLDGVIEQVASALDQPVAQDE